MGWASGEAVDGGGGGRNADSLAALAVGQRFVLDALGLSEAWLTPTDALLLLFIIEANAAQVSSSPRLQMRYARIEEAPTPDVQRPVSVLSIAEGLGLPFETVRRRIGRIAGRGFCEVDRAGCRVPPGLMTGDAYAQLATRTWSLLDGLCTGLAATGATPQFQSVGQRPLHSRAPVRLVSRTLGDYILRSVASAVPARADLVDRLIVMTVHTATSATGVRPHTTTALIARTIRSDRETTRRRVAALGADGVLVRDEAGSWRIAPLARLALEEAAAAHLISARRCVTSLERFGVLHRLMPRRPRVTAPGGPSAAPNPDIGGDEGAAPDPSRP